MPFLKYAHGISIGALGQKVVRQAVYA
jgi:hypothetical protein